MIGVFDSGLGGLTILKEFLRELPEYGYIYFGDNGRGSYGNSSQKVIYKYTLECIDFLFKEGCELIIIACNTVSADALKRLQEEYLPGLSQSPLGGEKLNTRRILGVIVPAAEEAAKIRNIKNLGLIGTRATVESGTYEKELRKINPELAIFRQSCPLLAPLVEEGWAGRPETKKILKRYLRPLKDKKVDCLILGCTHYHFLEKEIKGIMGKRVWVLDSPKIVAKKLKDYLKRHPEIDKKLEKNKKRIFYTTGDKNRFKEIGKKFLGREMEDVKKIEL